MAGQGQAQTHRDAEGAADAAVLGCLPKGGQLRVVERTVQDQLSVDRHKPALRFRCVQSGREPTENPLTSFGEPPNVGELSGADRAWEHLGGRRSSSLPPASGGPSRMT